MGVSCDYASSILLCAEDNRSILAFDDEEEMGISRKAQWSGFGKLYEQKAYFLRDSFLLFSSQSEECLSALLKKESEHLPERDYAKRMMSGSLDISVRKDAVDWIMKAHAYYSFGPLSFLLSVNYLDRFLSAYELPRRKAWMTQLLAVACLSLATKMEETEVPLSLDLQIGNAKYVFEAKTIQRMELLVLSTLKWRMHSVTPFSFIDYFLHKFNDGNTPKQSEINQCLELISYTTKEAFLIAFKPSEVAAAVALAVLCNANMVVIDKALNQCAFTEKEKVRKCYEAIQDMRLIEVRSHLVSTAPQSPVGVLDAKCLSYRSDETSACSESNSYGSVAAKKRKMNTPSV